MGWFLVAAAVAGFAWYVFRDDQRLGWMAWVAPAVLLAVGLAAWVGANRATQHTREQVAAQYQLGWSEGWADGCADLFLKFSPSGDLYYADRQYTYDWCVNLNNETLHSGYRGAEMIAQVSRPGVAHTEGRGDGFGAAIDATFDWVDVLCYGTDCVNRADYLSGSP